MSSANQKQSKNIVQISDKILNQLQSWSLSKNEFFAVLGEHNGIITEAIRIRNYSPQAKKSVEWKYEDKEEALKILKQRKVKYVADAHSHPGKNHGIYPSEIDQQHSHVGLIEFIVKTETMEVTAWRYGKILKETLENQLCIKIR